MNKKQFKKFKRGRSFSTTVRYQGYDVTVIIRKQLTHKEIIEKARNILIEKGLIDGL